MPIPKIMSFEFQKTLSLEFTWILRAYKWPWGLGITDLDGNLGWVCYV